MNLPNPYEHKHYTYLMAIPLVLMAIALFLVFVTPGIPKGIDLKGGTLVSIQASDANFDSAKLQTSLLKYSKNVEIRKVSTPSGTGVEIELESSAELEAAEGKIEQILSLDRQLSEIEVTLGSALANNQSATQLQAHTTDLKTRLAAQLNSLYKSIGSKTIADATGDLHAQASISQQEFADARQIERNAILTEIKSQVKVDSYSFKQIGSSLSKFFLDKTREVVFYSFLFSAIAVFIVFRSIAPSFAVIFGAVADVTITAGVMAVLGIPLTLASVATLLMLIGFSLDTDVMLTMRVIRRKEGSMEERAYESMKTGFLMNSTTIGAFGALVAIAYWLQIPTYFQIGSVALIGGFADFFATWCFNAPLILWYEKRRHAKQAAAQHHGN